MAALKVDIREPVILVRLNHALELEAEVLLAKYRRGALLSAEASALIDLIGARTVPKH